MDGGRAVCLPGNRIVVSRRSTVPPPLLRLLLVPALLLAAVPSSDARQSRPRPKEVQPDYPPRLPGGRSAIRDASAAWLQRPAGIDAAVTVAKTPPVVEFCYFPGQDYPGKPWSVWGESLFHRGKLYTAIGDHLAPAGNAFVHEYDPATQKIKRIADIASTLKLPAGHYVPGKIHSRIDAADDGWLYYSTHRGSTRVTSDAYHYRGDWILRHHPDRGTTEVVARGPVGKHCLPVSVVDPARLIFYGASEPGVPGKETGRFFAYDLQKRTLRVSVEDGPLRAIALARSTGRVYYTRRSDNHLMRYDPATGGAPVAIPGTIGLRAASVESPDGVIYTVSAGGKDGPATIHALDVRTEKVRPIGPAAVGSQQYITALALDPRGRYLYYCPGAHGSADRDGTPVVQLDTRSGRRKVIAFLADHFTRTYGCTPRGTYAVAVDDRGERLFITWNVSRGTRHWDCCGLSVVHIPASER